MTTRRGVRVQVGCEVLEERELFAANITLTDGVVTVQGTPGADRVLVRQRGPRLMVQMTGPGREAQVFTATAVRQVLFQGGRGQDTLVNATDVPTRAFGGYGDDHLEGGGGADFLDGGDGDDVLVGGGDDSLFGGDGEDLLIRNLGGDAQESGFGNDLLNGSSGTDVLSGGGNDTPTYDHGDYSAALLGPNCGNPAPGPGQTPQSNDPFGGVIRVAQPWADVLDPALRMALGDGLLGGPGRLLP